MQKVIIIGQSALNFTFPAEAQLPCNPIATPAGPLLNAAPLIAAAGLDVSFVSEAARDFLGNIILNFLKSRNVDTTCIDLFADGGATAVNFCSENNNEATVPIRKYPENQPFNSGWPRIDSDDLVIFGGFFALNNRSRPQVVEIINYARQRGALIIYLPGFNQEIEPRITRIMPALLDNLELSDIVLTSSANLSYLFNNADPDDCFKRNIKFYCNTLLSTNADNSSIIALHGEDKITVPYSPDKSSPLTPLLANVLTSLVEFLHKNNFNTASLQALPSQKLEQMAQESAKHRKL